MFWITSTYKTLFRHDSVRHEPVFYIPRHPWWHPCQPSLSKALSARAASRSMTSLVCALSCCACRCRCTFAPARGLHFPDPPGLRASMKRVHVWEMSVKHQWTFQNSQETWLVPAEPKQKNELHRMIQIQNELHGSTCCNTVKTGYQICGKTWKTQIQIP